jgi:hypothetical protein
MRKRYIIEESEKERILEMHKALIQEQNQSLDILSDDGKKNTESNPNEQILRKAQAAGCLGDKGSFQRNSSGTNTVYRTTTKSGKQVDFYGDMTYKFSDGTSGTWKCDKLTQTTSRESQKQAYIDKFTGAPYNYVLNVPDINKQKFTELDPVNDLKIPVGVFAVTDKFYLDPSKNKEIKRSSDSTFNDVLENQSIERGACRKNIEDYYKAYKRKNSIVIDAPTFDKAKRIVQACKDEHYGKWGILGGGMARGMNWDKILDTMSGGSGGPLTYGEDSKWKLK